MGDNNNEFDAEESDNTDTTKRKCKCSLKCFKRAIEDADDDDPNKKSKAYKDMMKNERTMRKVKKYWRSLKVYSKFMRTGGVKREEEEEEYSDDDNDEEDPIKCMLIPGKSRFLTLWSLFMACIISVSIFLICVTLAFSLITLKSTRVVEQLIDVLFVIDAIIRLNTAYYHQEVKLVTNRFRIFRRYLFSFMLFDVVSTIPSLFSYQLDDIYFLKLFRIVRIMHVIWPLYDLVDLFVTDKKLIRKLKESIFILILFSVIHPLACCWVYIGRKQNGSWIDEPNDYENFDNNYNIYIAALYWVVTTLTTVGYGDIKGFTINEYLFQMGVEFIGIGVFALFVSAVNNTSAQTDIVEDKIEDLDWWLYKLDSTRGEEKIPGPLYYSIKRFVETSLKEDFNMIIEDFDFYYKLKPSLRYEIIDELFGEFVEKFNILFINPKEGNHQEKGFTSDFTVNLYCRVYIPGQDIVKYHEQFDEMYLIREGGISVLHVEEFGRKDSQKRYMEIIELPPNSFFGEYQIVLKLKSTFIYKSNDGEDTSTMCIKKNTLLQLLDEYPKIKTYWENQGKERRIEFKRISLIAKHILHKEHAKEVDLDDDDDDFDEIPVKSLKDYEDIATEMDFDDDVLEKIETSEKIPDKSQRVKANATKKAQQGLEVIENEIDIFNEILESHQDQFETNLDKLSQYVKESRRNPNTNLPVPEMLLSENSPSDVLRNFVQHHEG